MAVYRPVWDLMLVMRGSDGRSNMTRPSVFIGSTKERLDVAQAIESNLQYAADVTLWTLVFELSRGYLESLVETARQFDFAVLALTADDLVQSRGQTVLGPRDNVLFELGLFTGLLGRERTFILEDRSQSLKIPTDLFGVTMASYDGSRADKNFEAAVSPACTQVMGRIDELGPLHVGSLPEFCSLFRDAVRESLGLQRIWAEYKLEECLGQVRRLVSADELEYGENDHDLVMGHLYGNTSAGDWIHAVSYDELADWKDALLGVQYSDINFDTAKKGVKAERIFVYDDVAELRALRPVLDRQKSNRIKVRIACASGLDRGKLHHENRLILSVKALGRYTVWPEHSPDGKLIKATVSWNPRTIQRFERIYKIVRSVSKPWDARTKKEVPGD